MAQESFISLARRSLLLGTESAPSAPSHRLDYTLSKERRQDGWTWSQTTAVPEGFVTLRGGEAVTFAETELCTGSMADVPESLLEQIKQLEETFTVDKKKLKEVTAHFVKELEKGKPAGSHLQLNMLLTAK